MIPLFKVQGSKHNGCKPIAAEYKPPGGFTDVLVIKASRSAAEVEYSENNINERLAYLHSFS